MNTWHPPKFGDAHVTATFDAGFQQLVTLLQLFVRQTFVPVFPKLATVAEVQVPVPAVVLFYYIDY